MSIQEKTILAIKNIAAIDLLTGASGVFAQTDPGTVNAICSTDLSWCVLAAQEFAGALAQRGGGTAALGQRSRWFAQFQNFGLGHSEFQHLAVQQN
jgi:hypothetical protein